MLEKLFSHFIAVLTGLIISVFIISKQIDREYISRRHLNLCEYAQLSLRDCISSAYVEYEKIKEEGKKDQ